MEYLRGVCRAEEACLELGGGEVDAVAERRMEVAGEGGGVAPLGILEAADGAFREVEAEHGADPVEGEGLPLDG